MSDVRARDAFVDRLADVGASAGMPRMAARVLAHLLTLDDGRATSLELSASLQASPAAVSGAVRYLEQLTLVRRTRERGSRRDHFVLDRGMWAGYMVRGLDVLDLWSSVLQSGAEAVGRGTPAGSQLAEDAELFAYLGVALKDAMQSWREAHPG